MFNLDLTPNKPNILVAPNGFGKSSFAIAFDSLKSNKIELDEKSLHKNNPVNKPYLSIALSTGQTLVADENQNSITNFFDVFVINNQVEPKSKVQSFGGKTFAKTSLDIHPTVLVSTIPPKTGFNYVPAVVKTEFGVNGNKLLNNISSFFKCGALFHRIENEIDFSRFDLKKYRDAINNSIEQINQQTGSANSLKSWIENNILPIIQGLGEYQKLIEIINSFKFKETTNNVDLFLSAWQILIVKYLLGTDFKKACKYLYYLDEKEDYTQTISSFNPVKDRFDIKPTEDKKKNSLIVNWPKAHEISNGQRDILTFIALLLRARRNFKKKDCILIIDEIFDYMDDANLITFQYYISTFIDEMKRSKRRIFPILLTHLDPLFFNHFCFNDSKIKVNYIKDINIKSNQQILKLIYKRAEASIQAEVDTYYFHFHPNISHIDLTVEFAALNLNEAWAKPEIFLKKIFREVRRYLFEDSTFDPLAICFGVRIQIEKLVYDNIPDAENKRIFIEEVHGTKNKLHFAQSIGVHIPETYFLLGIIYNTSLHLSEGYDISKPLGLKLENSTIKQMIRNIF
ncbi:MAG: hypothetical protein PHS11_08240 [Eubacteriales bacterium]|nr:hypothetical protein [Eubacteriales bacterium]